MIEYATYVELYDKLRYTNILIDFYLCSVEGKTHG